MFYEHTKETVEAACKRKSERVGYELRVDYPARDELFLDYDSSEAYERGLELLAIAIRESLVSDYFATVSPSGRGYHVRVSLQNPLESVHERIALQAALGSDPKRELLSLVCHADGCKDESVSVFFERV